MWTYLQKEGRPFSNMIHHSGWCTGRETSPGRRVGCHRWTKTKHKVWRIPLGKNRISGYLVGWHSTISYLTRWPFNSGQTTAQFKLPSYRKYSHFTCCLAKIYLLHFCSRGMETSRNSPDRWCVQLQPGWTQSCCPTPLSVGVWGAAGIRPQGSSGSFGPLGFFGPFQSLKKIVTLSIISSFWQAYGVLCKGQLCWNPLRLLRQ